MTKEEYSKCIDTYKAYYEYEDKLADLNINLWERDEVSDILGTFLDLLAELAGDTKYSDGYTWTSYFCYECEFGAKAEDYPVEVDGNVYYLRTSDDVWNLIHLD